jgi:PAS domain S-box-containing protein
MSTIQVLSLPVKCYRAAVLVIGILLILTMFMWPDMKQNYPVLFFTILIVIIWFWGLRAGISWNQEELEKERDLLSKILNRVGSLIVVIDREGRIVRFNKACDKFISYSCEEIKSKYFWDLLIVPERRENYQTFFRDLIAGKSNHKYDDFSPAKDGRNHLISWDNTVILDAQGKVEYIIGNGWEITESKQIETALREGEARFRSIFESNMIGIGFWESKGKIVDANDALLKILGYPKEDVVSNFLNWQEITPSKYWQLDAKALDQIQATGSFTPYKKEYIRKDGTRLPILIGGSNWEGCKDKGVFFVLDISDTYSELRLRKQAEVGERQANRKLTKILESITDAFFTINRRWEFTYVNNHFLNLIGKPKAELLGYSIWEIFPEAIGSNFYEQYHKAMFQQLPVRVEANAPNGSGQWFEARAYPWSDGLAVYFQDISKRKLTEQALRESEARVQRQLAELDHVYQTTPVGLCFVDANLRLVRVNEYLAAVNGRETVEMLGLKVREALPEMADWLEPFYQQVIATQRPLLDIEIQAETLQQPGIVRDWLMSYYPVIDNEGLFLGVSTVVQEITDRKKAERLLEESSAIFRRLFEANIFGVAISDFNGRITYANEALLNMVGYTRKEMLSGVMRSDQLTPPEHLYLDAIAAEELRTTGVATPFEKEYIRKDGSRVPILLGGAMLGEAYNEQNKVIRFYINLTEIKQVEAERVQLLERECAARAEAESANRMKDEFLATLSHELRTPLNSILGWAQLLCTRKFDEKMMARALETIERQARLQKRLIDDILDVSQIIQGKLCLNVRWFDIVEMIELAMNSVSLMAGAKSIELEAVVDPAVGLVWGDVERLQQVIWNLLANAIKFTPQGGRVEVVLRLMSAENGENGEDLSIVDSLDLCPFSSGATLSKFTISYIEIRVCDNGNGISPEFLPFVFERFRQADSSVTRTYGGLGLGLAIVRHLVELHGGVVIAESEGEGKGATFTVRLPLKQGHRDRRLGVDTSSVI